MSLDQASSSKALPPAAPADYDAHLAARVRRMRWGDSVILSLPNGTMKMIELKEGSNKTISLGKYGSFPPSALEGQLYGLTYTISDPAADDAESTGSSATLVPLRGEGLAQVEDTDATNELIADTQGANQTLTMVEIDAMKAAGATAQEIIAKQIERHTAFHLKNAYSQDKYKKRKEQKFGRSLTPLAPTPANLIKFHLARFPASILSLREDSFAQLLSNGNVRPGGRYLVVDDTGGLVVGGMLERMGGRGRILALSDTDSPPTFHILQNQMNFPPSLVQAAVGSLNWHTASPDWVSVDDEPALALTAALAESAAATATGSEAGDAPMDDDEVAGKGEGGNEDSAAAPAVKKGRVKTSKVGRLRKKVRAREELLAVREEFLKGEWDGLILATAYEPHSIISFLSERLAGSASISVYSPYLSVLSDAQAKLRAEAGYLNPIVTESWLRHYQVLPGRSHPFMGMSGTGGFLLSALKVYVGQETQSVMATRSEERARAQARKRQKREDEANGVVPEPRSRKSRKLVAGGVAASAGVSGTSLPAPASTAGEDDDDDEVADVKVDETVEAVVGAAVAPEEEEMVNDLV